MADLAPLAVTSLAHAIEAFMEAPTASRMVVITSVEVGRSAALLAFLQRRQWSGLWKVGNDFRLNQLAKADRLLSAIAIDVLPVLVPNPTSPTVSMLSRYGVHVQSIAPTVGGKFEERATAICKDLITYANNTPRHPQLLSAADLLRRLNMFRSETVTIADYGPGIYSDAAEMEAMGRLDHIHVDSFRRIASLREEVVDDDTPPAERRITIQALPASHSSALLGVAQFECVASDWMVHNLAPLQTLADVDVSFQVIMFGILPFLQNNPASQHARQFLLRYARRVRANVKSVGGEFVVPATIICNDLITTSNLPAAEMMMATEDLRGRIEVFRSRDFTLHDDNFPDDYTSDSIDEFSDNAAEFDFDGSDDANESDGSDDAAEPDGSDDSDTETGGSSHNSSSTAAGSDDATESDGSDDAAEPDGSDDSDTETGGSSHNSSSTAAGSDETSSTSYTSNCSDSS